MTIIAANRDMMAADSQAVWEGNKFLCDKIFEVNGDCVGTAGDVGKGHSFISWYGDQSKDRPELGDEFAALVLTKSGKILQFDGDCYALELKGRFFAVGSGSGIAMGAMAAGKTPEEAARIACKHAEGCGPPVKVFKR